MRVDDDLRVTGYVRRARAWIDGFSSAHTTNCRAPTVLLPSGPRTGRESGRPSVREVRVAREDPRAVVPRADRVLSEPPPDRDRRDRRDDPTSDRLPRQLSARPARERDARSAGSSHARALTSATCPGGKTPRPTRPRSLLKPLQPLLAEAVSPRRNRLARLTQALGDLRVRSPLGRPTRSPSPAPHPGRDPSTPQRAARAHAAAHRSTPPGAETSAPSPPRFADSVMTPSNSPRISEDDH